MRDESADAYEDGRPRAPCPHCGELILEIARKCKHCGEFLDDVNSTPATEVPLPPPPPSPPDADAAAEPTGRRFISRIPPDERPTLGSVIKEAGETRKNRAMIGNRPEMVCPHCGKNGTVSTKGIKRKDGISGGKATLAILSGGFSLLATGLSRKKHGTVARCANCEVVWQI